jgi:hypothetical protein
MLVITEPSICIPRTFNNMTRNQVKDIFEILLGRNSVDRVDIVINHQNPSPFCRIFVHLRYWSIEKDQIGNIRDRLIDGDTIKLVYDNPWYWKCVASKL